MKFNKREMPKTHQGAAGAVRCFALVEDALEDRREENNEKVKYLQTRGKLSCFWYEDILYKLTITETN